VWGQKKLHHFELPLYFTPYNHSIVSSSIWNPIDANGTRCPYKNGTPDSIRWAADTIESFIRDQQQFRLGTLTKLKNDATLKKQVSQYQGLSNWLQATSIPFI